MAAFADPIATAARKTRVPMTTGAPTASRISSSVHATGWTMAVTTPTRVSASMMIRKVRLPKPWPSGTVIAR